MRRIIVSDIFGKTPALDKLCHAIIPDIDIIDPYCGKFMDFPNEHEAYKYFMKQVGINEYCQVIKSILSKESSLVTLIGFSVGGSAIWKIFESLKRKQVKRIFCFYSSQIRHSQEINLSCKVDFVMPAYEPGFSIEELSEQLSTKENVTIHSTSYLHGFMNKYSENFSQSGYNKYVDWLRKILYK
jgi:dienelactone hydrolase